MPDPTPCHACTSPAGPLGFCGLHQNRLNGRSMGLLDHMTLADRIAIAAHPGWRGRPWRLDPRMWEDGLFFHTSPKDGIGPGYRTAPEALSALDRLNGLTPASDLDALRARLAEVERQATEQRHRAEAAEDALTDIAHIVRGEMVDPWPPGEPKPDTIAGRAYDAVCRLVGACDDLKVRRRALAADVAALQEKLEATRYTLYDVERERDAARKRVEDATTSYRHASETADYMRARLLPALDAAGVRYDDPPEALRLWVERQEEALDRQASDLAAARAGLNLAEARAKRWIGVAVVLFFALTFVGLWLFVALARLTALAGG